MDLVKMMAILDIQELKEISTDENGDEVAAPQEVYDYYLNAMEKLKEKEKREQEESRLTNKNDETIKL